MRSSSLSTLGGFYFTRAVKLQGEGIAEEVAAGVSLSGLSPVVSVRREQPAATADSLCCYRVYGVSATNALPRSTM